jgi:hypothetical protein
VICFAAGPNPGYTKPILMLVGLRWDPHRWFREPREIVETAVWDRCVRFGRFHFLYEPERRALLEELQSDARRERVVLILRPEDAFPAEPVERILAPDGKPSLLIYDEQL